MMDVLMRYLQNKSASMADLFIKGSFKNPVIGFLIFLMVAHSLFASQIRENSNAKPWMLFVTQLIPPRGPQFAKAFTSACFEPLKTSFDTTSYQVVLLQPGQTIQNLSNNKKDLILSSDSLDFWVQGKTYDTLVFWLCYRVGFNHSRITIPYQRGLSNVLPELAAQAVISTATTEFLCSLMLRGGPPGISISFTEDITAFPPCYFYLPPGDYEFKSTFPGFKTRIDSMEFLPGKTYSKRILLLPQ
jgi:hypothetical protein